MNHQVGKRATLFLGSILILALIVSIGWSANGRPSAKTVWEYKVITATEPTHLLPMYPERELNSLGMDGWELAYFIPEEGQPSRLRGTWILKRPK
jgi:hypothetical protein